MLGIFPEPCYSNCRIELAKAICILQVLDDMFDTYGTLDELILFTEAIQRFASRVFFNKTQLAKLVIKM